MRNSRTPLGSESAMRRLRVRSRASLSIVAVLAALSVVPQAGSDTLDAAPPAVTYSIIGNPGTNGWYTGSSKGSFVVVNWTVTTPPGSVLLSTSGCEPGVQVRSPNAGETLTCSATTDGGTSSVTTKTIKVDAEPPTSVAASATRAPDANGWYNHPVGISWHGGDATSGIASCTALTFPGPGLAAAGINGVCTDAAGNSTAAPFALRYDATPPDLRPIAVASGDGTNALRWQSTSPTDSAVVTRIARGSKKDEVVFRGTARAFTDKSIRRDLEYTYAVQTFDEAGNGSAVRSAVALPRAVTLARPGYVPRTPGAPILHWPRRRGASYYHVQLFRNGRRILASWPLRTKLALHARWNWQGRRYRLSPATYAWYVWAGFGARSASRYKLLGDATFIVSRARG